MRRYIKIIIAGETNVDNMPLWKLCEIPLISCPHYNFISHSSQEFHSKLLFGLWMCFFFGNFIFFCSHTTTRWFSLLSCSIGNENKNMLRISVFIVTIVAYVYMWWSHHKESCSSWLLLVKKINIILQIIFKLFW